MMQRALMSIILAVLQKDGELVASNIFEWYQSDWGTAADVLAHARKYASPDTLKMLEGAKTIDAYDYDWSLNDTR